MANFFYDLAGADPIIKDLIYNEEPDGDVGQNAITYRGTFVKVHDYDARANGRNVHRVEHTTVSENLIGIMMEEVAITETFLLNVASATGNWTRKKVLVNPNAVYLVEYARRSAIGTDNSDDGITMGAGDTASTVCPDLDEGDHLIGGWLYFLDGSAAGELHNILDSQDNATNGIQVLRTAMTSAVADGDTYLIIMPPFSYRYKLDNSYVNFKAEMDEDLNTDRFIGIDYWMKSPGWPFQKLTASIHDGLVMSNARFFHEVMLSKGYLSGVHTVSG